MKGRLGYDKWSVSHLMMDDYLAERTIDGKSEQYEIHSHCLQCAKVDVLSKYGGRVDLRGWHLSSCGSFLKAMQEAINQERDENV